MPRARLFFPLLALVAALAAACGGGGGGSSPIPAPTVTPHAGPTQLPVGPTPQSVLLSGGGYTLGFSLPGVTTGATSTMTAVLQTSLPAGTVAPQAGRRLATPKPLASTVYSGLVYLVISTADNVGFSSIPSFVFTLPAGTSIPPGGYAYVLYWDPYVAGSSGWSPVSGPGTVSGQSISFPGASGGLQFNANAQYIFALAVATQPQPTATPAPTPTPTINPSAPPSALPAYCATFSTPAPNSIASPQPVYFNDQSGTGAQVYFYVVEGADANGQTRYLGADGAVHNFAANTTAPAFPLECFPGSTHNGVGKTFELPPPPSTGYGANFFIAYATPQPGDAAPPNPLSFTGNSSGGYTGPSFIPGASPYAYAPADFIEYQLPASTLDITEVDKIGLPIQVTQNSGKYGNVSFGFASSTQYAGLLSELLADNTYSKLAVSTTLNGKAVLSRILAPQDAYSVGFPQDWWYNASYNAPYASSNLGFVQYLLKQYQQTPEFFSLKGVYGINVYCATSDGSSTLLFYNAPVSQPPCPSTLSGSPAYSVNAASALGGTTTVGAGYCQSILFATPWGSAAASGGVLADQNAFYLWKALVTDINRGFALNPALTHPYPTWSTAQPGPLPFSGYFPSGTMFNHYAYLLHKHMINNLSYAIPYDEPGGQAPTTTSDPSVPLQVTVWTIPAYTPGLPTPTPPTPSPACPPSL